MGVYLKNKPSRLNYKVSTGILQFLLMGVLSIWLLMPSTLHKMSSQDSGLVELEENVGDEDIDQILILLNQENWIDKLSIKHISKDEAISIMSSDIGESMMDRVKQDNPFRDVITFSTFSHQNQDNNFSVFKEKMSMESGIAGIYNLEEVTSSQQPSVVGSLSKTIAIPLTVIVAILGYLLLNSGVRSVIDANRNMVTSLSIYGSESSFLKGIFKNQLLKDTFVGWLIGLTLFIMAFYLIIRALSIGFSDISTKMMALTVLLPLLLMVILTQLAINKQITNLS